MADDRLAEILGQLRKRGGHVTAPRRAIIAALLEAGEHVTAEELVEVVKLVDPEIHLSTVSRTLEALTELGVVTHVHLGHGPAVYHLSDDVHFHLVCYECGAIIELPPDAFDALGDRFQRDYGFRLDERHFALGGHCRACA
jgi:Fe2+ or Zn2+ uptake regulation protein